MSNQIVKEQVENKIQIVAEVDSVIKAVCEKVKNEDLIVEGYAQTIKALAELVVARAFIGH